MLNDLDQESILLLYLANELSQDDRLLVEQQLQQDGKLLGLLEQLRSECESFENRMGLLDQSPVRPNPAVLREIGAVMRQGLARRLGDAAVHAPTAVGSGRKWWLYPAASAAAAVILGLAWWGNQPAGVMKQLDDPKVTITFPSLTPSDEDRVATADGSSLGPDANFTQPKESMRALEAAERQVAELTRDSNESSSSYFGFPNGNE